MSLHLLVFFRLWCWMECHFEFGSQFFCDLFKLEKWCEQNSTYRILCSLELDWRLALQVNIVFYRLFLKLTQFKKHAFKNLNIHVKYEILHKSRTKCSIISKILVMSPSRAEGFSARLGLARDLFPFSSKSKIRRKRAEILILIFFDFHLCS